jgi:hypothetical protein
MVSALVQARTRRQVGRQQARFSTHVHVALRGRENGSTDTKGYSQWAAS